MMDINGMDIRVLIPPAKTGRVRSKPQGDVMRYVRLDAPA